MGKPWPPSGYPLVKGFYELTEDWGLTLPEEMARHADDDCLILWRPGLTITVTAYGEGEEERNRKKRLRDIKREADPDGRVIRDSDDGEITRFAYRMLDVTPDGEMETLSAFAVTDHGHLQLVIHFDDPKDEAKALALFDSVAYAGLPPQ